MTPEAFAKEKLNVTGHQFRYVLSGKRNLSYQPAKVASEILVTEIDVWLDQSRQAERQAAWERFCQKKAA